MEHKNGKKTGVEHTLKAVLSSCSAMCGTHLILPFQNASRFWNGRRYAAISSPPPQGGVQEEKNVVDAVGLWDTQ